MNASTSVRSLLEFLLLLLLPTVVGYGSPPDPTFARRYTTQEILGDPAKREAFIDETLASLAPYFQPGIGYNPTNGMTWDGRWFDFDTAQLFPLPRLWSAASKEGFHVQLCALAILGNARAQKLIAPGNPAQAPSRALEILRAKVATLERFHAEWPGYVFLPWFVHAPDGGIRPSDDWLDRTAGLDGGELSFALILAEHATRATGDGALADRLQAQLNRMSAYGPRLFLDSQQNKLRAVVRIGDPKLSPNDPAQTYTTDTRNGGPHYLDDPHEGELLLLFLTGFAKDLPPAVLDAVWANKTRGRVDFPTSHGTLTCEAGHWFSAHEQLGKLFEGFHLELPRLRQVFLNGEKARTHYSAANRIPGLLASTQVPVTRNANPRYASAVGVPPLATQPVDRLDIVTPAAAFAVMLADETYGLAFLRVMLSGRKAVTPFGPADSSSVGGDAIAPVLTMDTLGPLALAFCLAEELRTHGEHPVSRALKTQGVYDTLASRLGRDFDRTFAGSIQGESIPFAAPTAELPAILPDFAQPDPNAVPQVLRGIGPDGSADLLRTVASDGARLTIPAAAPPGYLFYIHEGAILDRLPSLVFEVATASPTAFLLELKDDRDRPLVGTKIRVEIPGTDNAVRRFAADLGPLVPQGAAAAVFVLSDPAGGAITFHGVTFEPGDPSNATRLRFDGRRFTTAPADPALLLPFWNLQKGVNYNPGGAILFEFSSLLSLWPSLGWIWSPLPSQVDGVPVDTDLNRNPHLSILYRSLGDSAVFLELKNAGDLHLIGQPVNGVPKIQLGFEDTGGPGSEPKLLTVDLRPLLRPAADRRARILAFSDPSGGQLEILAYGVTATPPVWPPSKPKVWLVRPSFTPAGTFRVSLRLDPPQTSGITLVPEASPDLRVWTPRGKVRYEAASGWYLEDAEEPGRPAVFYRVRAE